MKKETIMFCGSVFLAVAAVGIQGTIGLFIFGVAWLLFGKD